MNSEKELILTGIAASAGRATGKARLFMPSEDYSSFKEGEILVTTLTDPTMVQAMVRAAAIVTDLGGITSHPAILSREMGIPCVVNTKKATTTIKEGMTLLVDGGEGEVYLMD